MSETTSLTWQTLKELVDRALDLPAEERQALLDQSCAGDARLRAHAESLLDMDATVPEGLVLEDSPTVALSEADDVDDPFPDEPSWSGSRLGPYRILRKLGQGGMGSVYLARREDGEVEQEVAIKVVGRGPLSFDLRRRFLLERQVLARLNHPHIAHFLDGGTTDRGLPYLVMERVEGEPILDYCRNRSLDLDARLVLFDKVCAAVGYAHRNLVVHRDLKPSNILVQGDGNPKLLDFGIAKLLDEAEEGLTRPDLMPGTLGYASPEQMTGRPITTASDVYSLGVVLYEMLTYERPFGSKDDAVQALARALQGEEPPAPSRSLRRRLTLEDTVEPRPELILDPKDLEGDLDHIVLRAVAADPVERYGTAGELAADIERFRKHEPVSAVPTGVLYRARKFVRRRRGPVIAGCLIFLSLLGGLVARSLEARRAERERATAVAERARAEELATFMIQDLWQRLEPHGLLHVLEPIAEKLLAYHETRDATVRTPEERKAYLETLDAVAQVLALAGEGERVLDVRRQRLEEIRRSGGASSDDSLDRELLEAEGLLGLAVAYRELGRSETLDAFEQAETAARSLFESRPDDPQAVLLLLKSLDEKGIALYDEGNIEEARAAFSEVEAWFRSAEPGFPGEDPPRTDFEDLRAAVLLHLGVTWADSGDPGQGLRYLDASVAAHRENWRRRPEDLYLLTGLAFARSVRAENLILLGRLEEAVDAVSESLPALREAIQRDPANAEVRYQTSQSLLARSIALRDLGRSDEARDTFEEIVEVAKPLATSADLVYLKDVYVRALLALGRIDEARAPALDLLRQGWSHRSFDELCAEHGIRLDSPPPGKEPS